MRYFLSLACIILLSVPVMAQDPVETEGELKDVEIEIVKDREIVLPKASRRYNKIPPAESADGPSELEYFYESINFPLPALPIRMRPLRIRNPELQKTYGNYVRGGLGNFGTGFLEGYLNSKRNEDYSYGAHIDLFNSMRGPVAKKNSSSADYGGEIFGKYFAPTVTFNGELGYRQRQRKFYGAPEVRENGGTAEKQSWKNFTVKAGLENTDNQAVVDYALGFQFDHLSDLFDARETEFQVDANIGLLITEGFDLDIDADMAFIGRDGMAFTNLSRSLVSVRPSVGFEYEGFQIRAGVNVAVENDSIEGFDKLHLYPAARASYNFSDKVKLYAGIDGGIIKNTLRGMSEANPFLANDVSVFHSNETFKFYGGVEGKLSPNVGFEAGFSAANVKNMAFFLNDTTEVERFNIIYDPGNTAVFNIFGAIGLVQADVWRVNFRGDYWGYGTSDIREAWHRPNYRIGLTAYYTLYEKIILSGELYAIGGIRAYDFDTDRTINLAPAFDFNFSAEYLVSDRFSAFLETNNIFSKEYELLYRYPVRGLQFRIGASYTF